MSDTDTMKHLDEVLDLAATLRPMWPEISAGIRASGAPTCEGEPDGADGGDPPAPDAGTEPPADKDWRAEADKWKALARKHEGQAKQNTDAARKLAELEEAEKTEFQRATDKVTAAEKRAAEAEATVLRLEVALDRAPEGMSLAQVRKLANRLAGASREELEADADELFADFTPDTGTDDPARRPKERLRPGAVPDADPGDEPSTGLERMARAYAKPST